MSHSKREPRSPYARYNKRPFTYSPAYKSWAGAADEEERARTASLHAKQFLGFDPQDYPTGRYPGVSANRE